MVVVNHNGILTTVSHSPNGVITLETAYEAPIDVNERFLKLKEAVSIRMPILASSFNSPSRTVFSRARAIIRETRKSHIDCINTTLTESGLPCVD